jgi:uncharacterized membrane protein
MVCAKAKRRRTARVLWKRGVWLILLDLIVVRFAFFFSLTSGPLILSVLWALGWSMIVLSLLVRLPMRGIAALSIAMILLDNLADRVTAAAFGAAGWMWKIVHEPGVIPVGDAIVLTAYPLVPWSAVMAAGFCFGPIALTERDSRQRWLLWFGCGLTLAFLSVRWLNVYGDPQPWSVQGTPGRTVLAFLRCTKYPPSLAFLLMTLGPAMLIWAWLDRLQLRRYNPLLVFGRVPLFLFHRSFVCHPRAHGCFHAGSLWHGGVPEEPVAFAGRIRGVVSAGFRLGPAGCVSAVGICLWSCVPGMPVYGAIEGPP